MPQGRKDCGEKERKTRYVDNYFFFLRKKSMKYECDGRRTRKTKTNTLRNLEAGSGILLSASQLGIHLALCIRKRERDVHPGEKGCVWCPTKKAHKNKHTPISHRVLA